MKRIHKCLDHESQSIIDAMKKGSNRIERVDMRIKTHKVKDVFVCISKGMPFIILELNRFY